MGVQPLPNDPNTGAVYPGGQIWPYILTEKAFLCPTFSDLSLPTDHYANTDALGYKHAEIERTLGSAFTMHQSISEGSFFSQGLKVSKMGGSWQGPAGQYALITGSQLLLTEENLVPDLRYARTGRNDTAFTMPRRYTPNPLADAIAGYHPNIFDSEFPDEGSGNVAFFDAHVERVSPHNSLSVAWAGVKLD